jgi:hypothetical protein
MLNHRGHGEHGGKLRVFFEGDGRDSLLLNIRLRQGYKKKFSVPSVSSVVNNHER